MINKLLNKNVGVDTSLFIYLIEENNKYSEVINEFFSKNSNGYFKINTSVITLLEVLVLPYKLGREDLAQEYESILNNSVNIKLVEIDHDIAKLSAKLRAKYNLRTPDSLQIASSIYSDSDYFITNDKRLKIVKDIKILLIEDLSLKL